MLGEVLSGHVRYEERTLFGRVETELNASELNASELNASELNASELTAVGRAVEAAGAAHQPPRA